MSELLELAACLVDVSSVIHGEELIADLVEQRLRLAPDLCVTRIKSNVVARTSRGLPTRVVLAGHLDTVPPAGNDRALVEGTTLHGCGSVDMKGGIAVLLALASRAGELSYDTSWVFYACEEVARADSGLLEIERADASLLRGDLAILAEPTASVLEAGCQGVLRVTVRLAGTRAHSARPWTGRNAIHRLGPVLERLASFEERRPLLDGVEYRETVQAVRVSGGVANNVVPDEAWVSVSHRFAPDRDAESAFAAICDLLAPVIDPKSGDSVVLADSAPAAAPGLSHQVLADLLSASGLPARAKLGWTDVAFFAERGIAAANFGPGDPLLAHTPDEHVSAAELDRAYEVLRLALVRP